jgi:hypothetical protein
MSCGENEICAAPETDVRKFIRQITKRFLEIEAVLEQAELVGSRIKRGPTASISMRLERLVFAE